MKFKKSGIPELSFWLINTLFDFEHQVWFSVFIGLKVLLIISISNSDFDSSRTWTWLLIAEEDIVCGTSLSTPLDLRESFTNWALLNILHLPGWWFETTSRLEFSFLLFLRIVKGIFFHCNSWRSFFTLCLSKVFTSPGDRNEFYVLFFFLISYASLYNVYFRLVYQ